MEDVKKLQSYDSYYVGKQQENINKFTTTEKVWLL